MTAISCPQNAPEEDEEKIKAEIGRLADAKESSMDAAMVAVLSQLNDTFSQ